MPVIKQLLVCFLLFREECFGTEPVASWEFNKVSQGRDVSIYGENDVTMTNIVYGPGPNGEPNGAAILPKNISQQMLVKPSPRLRFKTAMTIFAHVYLNDNTAGVLIWYRDQQFRFGMVYDAYKKGIWLNGLPTNDHVGKGTIQPKQWHRLALVIDTTSITLYVNDTQVYTTQGTVDLTSLTTGDMEFGPGRHIYLNGRIACAQFYNHTLDIAEIRHLTCCNATIERPSIQNSLTVLNETSISVSWTKSSGQHSFRYSLSRTDGPERYTGTLTGTTVVFKNLKPGVTYRFTLLAINGGSESCPTTTDFKTRGINAEDLKVCMDGCRITCVNHLEQIRNLEDGHTSDKAETAPLVTPPRPLPWQNPLPWDNPQPEPEEGPNPWD